MYIKSFFCIEIQLCILCVLNKLIEIIKFETVVYVITDVYCNYIFMNYEVKFVFYFLNL